MRIVATADLHGELPDIPECDVLVVAGDVAPDYGRPGNTEHSVRLQSEWLEKHFAPWLEATPAGLVIGIAGNHDFALEADPDLAYWLPWVYLLDDRIRWGGINFYGIPWVPNLSSWAFHLDDARLQEKFNFVPEDTDVLITHGPPFGLCDHTVPAFGYVHAGFPGQVDTLQRVNPILNVCGHIHEGYGWDLAHNTLVANVAHMTETYEPINPPVTFLINDADLDFAFDLSFERYEIPPPQSLQAHDFGH